MASGDGALGIKPNFNYNYINYFLILILLFFLFAFRDYGFTLINNMQRCELKFHMKALRK